ncbi:MAG: sugar phosphate nucleotidyltransferase [Candidatus Hydrothermales bacterium]
MKVIIPIAGKGTRTYPLSFSTPKPLLRIKGKPILYYVTDVLKIFQPEEVIYVISPNLLDFIEEIKKIRPYKTSFVIQEKPLGLGDAILCAREKLKRGRALILLGDSIVKINLKFFDKNRNYIGIYKVNNPERFGVVTLKDGKIVEVEEKPIKPKSNLIICGIYYIKNIKKIFLALEEIEKKGIKTKGEFQLTDAFKLLIEEGEEFYPLKVTKWLDTGTLTEILETQRKILNRNTILEKTKIKNTQIIMPVWIDKNVIIENSFIGPYVSIEKNCEIKNSKIKNTIIYTGSKINDSEITVGIIGDYSEIKNLCLKEIFITKNSKVIG